MVNGLGASVSGLWVFVRKLENAARNIANGTTDGYKSKKATIVESEAGTPTVAITVDNSPGTLIQDPDGVLHETSNVNITEEMASLIVAKRGYEANLSSAKAHEEMLDALLDITI